MLGFKFDNLKILLISLTNRKLAMFTIRAFIQPKSNKLTNNKIKRKWKQQNLLVDAGQNSMRIRGMMVMVEQYGSGNEIIKRERRFC